MCIRTTVAGLVAACLLTPVAGAVSVGQLDDFQTPPNVSGWKVGRSLANSPRWVANGGPLGAGDPFLQVEGTGVGQAGSKPTVFNGSQWTGNYLTAGIAAIELDVKHLGGQDLSTRLRIGLEGPGGSFAWSLHTEPVAFGSVPSWQHAVFPIDVASLGGPNPAAVLGNVTKLWLFHVVNENTTTHTNAPRLNARIGYDNIHSLAATSSLTWDNEAQDFNWATVANWDPDQMPDANAEVNVANGDAVLLSTLGQEAKSVTIDNSTLHVTAGGNVTVTEGVSVVTGGTLRVDGTLTAAGVSVDGTLAGGGAIHGNPIEVLRTISPGNDGIGTLTLGSGVMGLAGSATYDAQVSLTVDAADLIEVAAAGILQLGGTLAVSGVGREDGSSWAATSRTIVKNTAGGTIEGADPAFDSVTPVPGSTSASHIGQGAFLREVDSTASSVDLELFIALGGDTDGDKKVWLSDWAALRANFGNTATGKTWTEGNFDPWEDGKVWLSDWAALRANFGNSDYTVAEAGASAVPEPGTVSMLLGLLAGLALAVRRRR